MKKQKLIAKLESLQNELESLKKLNQEKKEVEFQSDLENVIKILEKYSQVETNLEVVGNDCSYLCDKKYTITFNR